MIEMFFKEDQLSLFREFESRRAEFLRLDKVDKGERFRKEAVGQRCEKAIQKKAQGQLKAYRLQKEKIQIRTQSELNENSLKPQKSLL